MRDEVERLREENARLAAALAASEAKLEQALRALGDWTFVGWGEESPIHGGPHVIVETATLDQAKALVDVFGAALRPAEER